MRARLVGCLSVLAMTAASVAAAGTPMTLLLATAHGRDSVAVSTETARLHGRVWLYRRGGTGAAHGKATISCDSKKTSAGVSGLDEWFQFKIAPDSRQEVWRYEGGACAISISLHGHGELSVALRGY